MAVIHCDFYSDAMGEEMGFKAVIPEGVTEDVPTVYLLHGLGNNNYSWLEYTSIEKYANEWKMAVIMPEGGRSFFENTVSGRAYYTHVSEEVLAVSRKIFKLSSKREKTFIAGPSMGGYGAFKIAMRNPGVFSAAGSISGVTNIAAQAESGLWDEDFIEIFGSDYKNTVKGSKADLMPLAEEMAKKDKNEQVRLIQICGTSDYLYEDNVIFKDHAKSLGLDLTYMEMPGDHEWVFWNVQIKTILDFFAGSMN